LSVFPSRRLLRAVGSWLGIAVLAAAWTALLWPLVAALAVLMLLGIGDGVLLFRRPQIRVQRVVPSRAVIDRHSEIEYRLDNPGDAAIACELEDEWPPDLAETAPQFRDAIVAARSTLELRAVMQPTRRGDRPLGRLVLFEASPLGLLRRRSVLPAGHPVRVYPDARRLLRAASLTPKQLLGRAGARPTRRRGTGSEFESLRDYVVGDDPRHVDWSATARRGRLATRLYQHERNHTLVLAVDQSRLMGARCSDERTKLDHAVDSALTLALAALGQGDRVELLLFDQEVRGHVSPRVHRGEVGPLVELLRHAEPTGTEANYRRLARSVLSRRRGRALVVVLTDFADAVAADVEAPLRLLRRHHRTLLVALRDPYYERLRPDADAQPEQLFERIALNELLRDREVTLARLQRAAVQSVDLIPEQIAAPLLNRYLDFRYESA
jgi:uncharacterized protein (DUF58 family)